MERKRDEIHKVVMYMKKLILKLSDTEEKGPEFYEKDKGSAGIHGQIFEYKFCALSFLRATNKGYKFKLASNVKGFGAFDDVVVEYLDDNCSKKHIFLQLKSKVKQKVTMQQLMGEKGDFSLRKYYDSYIQVEKNFNCSEEGAKMDGSIDESLFIIYTNTDVARHLKLNKVTDIGEEEFLMTGGSVLQFNEEEHKAIYEHLQELPKHREFLSRLRIFYNQADEKEMDCHIKPELQQSMKLPDSELDLTYMCFIDFIKDWWQNLNYFLKDTKNNKEHDLLEKTKERVRTTLVAKVLDQRKIELDDHSIRYKESAITDMEEMIGRHKALLIFASGRSTTLTAAKIHQMLGATKHIIMNLQQIVRYKTEVMLAWKSVFDVLVLESQSSTENFQDVLNELSIILNECGEEKKFIFITHRMGNTEQISAVRRTIRKKLREEYDDWNFSDIVTETTTFLLEKKVIFQGTEIQIKHLVKESDFRMLKALDCDSMSLLLTNKKPSLGTPTENTLEYYIDRTLERVTNFKSGIQNEGEIMVQFRKESLEELQGTSSDMEKKCLISDHGKRIPQFSMANENEKGTTKQCRGNATLHNICTKDQKIPRRQCTDEISSVQRGFQRKSSKIWRPSTLLEGEDRIILVTDEPGMGKSTLLTHLAKQTRENHPDMWIVRVNINNYTSILHGIKTKGFEENAVIRLLMEAAKIKETEGAQLEKQLFNYIYNSTGNMAVLIDGVDEVSPHYTEEIIQILRMLSKTEIRKIWVTSRNSVKEQLEQECECQSYRLVPFSVEDQKSFLVKFWNQKFSHINAAYLETLAHRVVELSSRHLSVSETNFMGIPLQSMLLAEIYEEKLKKCSTSKAVELPEYINIVMLYDCYVNKKWDIYLSEKTLCDRTNVNVLTDDVVLYDIFINNHKAAALIAILSTQQLEKLNDKNVLKQVADFLQKIEQGLEKTGIITDIIEGRPVFLHRTFAEYLVAKRLCDDISESKLFMRDHLFESGFVVVRSMVDRILADKCSLHEAVLNSNMQHVTRLLKMKESITVKDRAGRTPMHVAVSCRNPQLTRLLLEQGADVGCVDTLLGLSPVEYAIRMGNWEILSLLMEKRPKIREQVLNEMNNGCNEHIVSALRAAAMYEYTDLLGYLISRGNCVNMALPGDSGTLLHEAARRNHIQTVKTLVSLGASCDIQDVNGKTALHVSAETGSVEVAKFIVERQDVCYWEASLKYEAFDRGITKLKLLNLRDNDGHTPLHLAAAAGNTSTVPYLLSAGSDVRSCNTRGEYPLTLAARYGRNDTVKLLLQSCSAVNCEVIVNSALRAAIVDGQVDTTALLLESGAAVSGGENEKPIHVASRMGHKEIVSQLLQYGASLTSRTETGNTALHLASETGHLSLVKYLVKLDSNGLNNPNYENETPLHLSARSGRYYLVTYFTEKGCNINAPSANGATCLHVASENGHYRTVEYLLKHGAEVNAVNSADQTPLLIAASRGQTRIVELLLLHNAIFSLRDKNGITAVLAASVNGHQDTVRFIVQQGGNIEDTDGKGNTIAHFAVANENYDILNFLWQQNISLEVQNSDGDTPLLLAVREGRKRVVQYLAAKQCDINTKCKDGMRPLDIAVLKGNLEIIRLLIERNAHSCKSGMHIVVAARLGFVDMLQRFVAMGDVINVRVDKGESPLHAACESGHIATVQYLCEHAALLDLQDNNGNTALHVAVSSGHLDVTRILVEKGVNLSAANESGSTALHIAAKGGYLNIVQYLAGSFAPIDKRNAKNETALLVAAAEGQEKIVRFLIEQGAGIGVRDIEGKTALDIAKDKGYTAITQLLKDRAVGRQLVCFISRTEINTVSESDNVECLRRKMNAGVTADSATDGKDADNTRLYNTTAEDTLEFQSNPRSALHTAAVNGNLEEVQRLVEGGIALDYGDPFGRTALWGAAKNGHKLIIRCLLQNGSCVNIPDCEDVRPTDIAVREGQWGAVSEFLKHDPKIGPKGERYLTNKLYEASESGDLVGVQIILKRGISVNTTNKNGNTPLHVAAKSGHKEVTSLLLKCGANANTADNDGKTTLELAAENGQVEIVRYFLSATAVTDLSTHVLSAATEGHMEVVRELLKHGASVNTADKDGETPLYKAGRNGHVEVIRELLKHGANVNTADNDGETPLYKAGENGQVEVVRELLKHGANVNTASNYGSTPLYAAGENGHVEVVREMLKHGANVNTASKYGSTPLYAAGHNGQFEVVRELLKHGANVNTASNYGSTPLYAAGENGHVEVVRELLKHGANVNTASNYGRTPLYAAGQNGHVEVVREMLKHGANVNTEGNYGSTTLYMAGENGHIEVVRELLKHGANVNTASIYGRTPLYAAGQKGDIKVVRELLKHGANVNTADKDGGNPLYIAGRYAHVEVVRELLKHGANVNTADKDNGTPLYIACRYGHVEVVRDLLKHSANVNTAEKDSGTPLYTAGRYGHVEVLLELLKHGANVNTAIKNGSTPLYISGENGHVEVVRELLKHGANVNTANIYGSTPLYAAGKNGHIEVVRELLNYGANVKTTNNHGRATLHAAGKNGHVEVVRELLKHGANVNTESNYGRTPLYAAGQNGHVEVVRELLKHGANVNAADKESCTPLYKAGQNGHVEVVRELLKHGANVNTESNYGRTPLYIAGCYGHVEVVRELLKHGANVNAADKESCTPLYIAGRYGLVEVVQVLLKHGANVNIASNYSRTPLYAAGQNGHFEVVRELLKHDANVNTADKDGGTTLYIAGRYGHVEVVRELLKHGANVNTADKNGGTPLYISSRYGHVDVVRDLLKHGANVNTKNNEGFTPLYAAQKFRHVNVVRELRNYLASA